jgi:PAS domain S-box-containing protein
MKPNASAFRRYLITVLDNIKEGVILVGIGPGGKFTLLFSNKAFHMMSGFGTDSVGKDMLELLHSSRHKFVRKHFEKVIKDRKPLEYTAWSPVPAGRRAFEIEMIPVVPASQKEVKEIIVTLRDVTQLIKLKEEVQTLRAAGYKEE